ncbi:MAG TPA: oxidoreductase, partial [Propionibacteriaceae bacterium]|nr:oxidoreductase [Propionibacteriaceae bacterium]
VAPGQALARAHALVARGVVPDDQLGRVADDPVIARRMSELGELLVRPTVAPAVVLAAVVHAEIATSGAFGAASGLVARGAEHLVLVASGLDPYGVIVVEAGHAADPAGYRAGLAGYAHGGVRGVSGWIISCATAVGRGAELSPITGTGQGLRGSGRT